MAICSFAFVAISSGVQAADVASASVEAETVSGSNAATTAEADGNHQYCRVWTDTDCYVSFGTAPNAGTDTIRFPISAGAVEYFRVKPGYKAACIAI